MPRRNWPHRLAKKRKKHRAHRMKRRTPAQRKGRGDAPQEQQSKQTTEAEAPPQGRKQVGEDE